jgi:hypothetical protein
MQSLKNIAQQTLAKSNYISFHPAIIRVIGEICLIHLTYMQKKYILSIRIVLWALDDTVNYKGLISEARSYILLVCGQFQSASLATSFARSLNRAISR